MTKKFEFNWQIPVPEPLLNGCIFDRWTEEKDNTDSEPSCLFKVDEYGFFIYWKSEGRVSQLVPRNVIQSDVGKTDCHRYCGLCTCRRAMSLNCAR